MIKKAVFNSVIGTSLSLLVVAGLVFSGLLITEWNNFIYVMVLFGVACYLFNDEKRNTLFKEQKIFSTLSALLFLTFSISALVAAGFKSLFSYQFSVFYILPFVFLVFYYINCVQFTIQWFWKIVVASGLYTVLYVILVFIENPARGTGLLEVPIARGNLAMLFGMLSFVAMLGLKQKLWKFLAALVFISGVLLSFKSGSRGGWITFITAYITVLAVYWKYDHSVFRRLLFLGGVVIMVITLMSDLLPIQDRLRLTINSLRSYFYSDIYATSLGYRFEMWKAAWYGFLQNPFFGWGFGSYDKIFIKFLEEGLVHGKPDHLWGHPHNDYMLFLSETGLIGFFFVTSLLLYPAYVYLRVIKTATQLKNETFVLLGITGLILVESIMEFMISDKTFSMRYQFDVYMVLTILLLTISSRYLTSKVKAE